MWWELFISFFKIGFLSFGGGYAMIPIIEYEVLKHGWLTSQQFTDVIAVAGMSPGPIATNSVIFVGYKMGGIFGAILSTLAISLPSLISVFLIAVLFHRIQHHHRFYSAFYILRPVITGLIAYAAVRFAINNGIISYSIDFTAILIMIGSVLLLLFTKLHPAFLIVMAGVAGICFYY
ncbi:chromate transporter [Ammoniphilus sp. YIM 78166]|uniref:chromate transporter n=1 Tax=Ammoniphilus sp. YIM 78166 TaxID=1644106 RepID=UPI00107058E1|nr:chromate transporter [Ammoniphilus sp. YIM 78166]